LERLRELPDSKITELLKRLEDAKPKPRTPVKNPKKAATRNTNRHFVVRGAAQPVAILIFVRKS
jgi:hypothetical protein